MPEGGSRHQEQQEILAQVQAGLDYVPEHPDRLKEMVQFFRWEMRHFLDPVNGVGPEDINPFELAALVALLGPAFMRRLSREPSLTAPEGLRLVG